jgi:tRNA dimethylallyltransferase
VNGVPPLLVIAGATATGKTGLSIAVARRLRDEGIAAEVISADSRQVFRGMDIGTAKATPAERAGVPHHGLDLVEPDEPFSVADFVGHVRGVLPGIAERHGIAILAGGTGLYLRAVAHGLDTDALPSDAAVRAGVESRAPSRSRSYGAMRRPRHRSATQAPSHGWASASRPTCTGRGSGGGRAPSSTPG